jgi:subtilisin family serine protease
MPWEDPLIYLSIAYPIGNATKLPDDDPYDLRGHGTHVSGIIAGKSEL